MTACRAFDTLAQVRLSKRWWIEIQQTAPPIETALKEKGISQDKRRCNQRFCDQINRAGFHSRNSQLVYQNQA